MAKKKTEAVCLSVTAVISLVRGKVTLTAEFWGPFLESPGNFSGPESYFMCAMFALMTQILLVLKAEQ